ncbi:MAG: DMT family transporter, partial [Anaerolineales bacterium]|nr:DMT family transporter [Anaerolineales bacterium]
LPINQRVLYDIPAPTVTLYTLLAMSVVVVPVYLLFDRQLPSEHISWWPLIGLTLVTFLSRLTLFLGVKHLGGMQTALLGLSELFVTITLSHLWLREVLGFSQWIGAALLGLSLTLIGLEKFSPKKRDARGGWLSWVRPPEVPPNIRWGP